MKDRVTKKELRETNIAFVVMGLCVLGICIIANQMLQLIGGML